ncbi:unnamed protein product [Linum trigynum]|uniref:Uncharacterized protein n=1 Tax=Linum trigynum TaxID=586398 RepID=A0AAV2G0G3_9ROSI
MQTWAAAIAKNGQSRGGVEEGLMVHGRGIRQRRQSSQGGANGRANRGGDSGEARWSRPGACRGNDGRLYLAMQPLDGLAVRLVPQLAGQLKNLGGADDWHPDSPPHPVDLALPVLRRWLLHRERAVGSAASGTRNDGRGGSCGGAGRRGSRGGRGGRRLVLVVVSVEVRVE